MTLALYLLIGALVATASWFVCVGTMGNARVRTRDYLRSWLILCAAWPAFLAYGLVRTWLNARERRRYTCRSCGQYAPNGLNYGFLQRFWMHRQCARRELARGSWGAV